MNNKELLLILKREYNTVVNHRDELYELRRKLTVLLKNLLATFPAITCDADSLCFCQVKSDSGDIRPLQISSVKVENRKIIVCAKDKDKVTYTANMDDVIDIENVLAFCVENCSDQSVKRLFS